MTSVGFIGAGRITRVMVEGWAHAGRLPGPIVVTDTNKEACTWGDAIEDVVVGSTVLAAAQDIVVVSLHPPVMSDVLPTLVSHLRPHPVVLSLAPKLKFADLNRLLSGFGRLARQNPNAPSIVNRGYNPIAFSSDLDKATRETLLQLLSPLGATPVVDEARGKK